MSSISLCMIVRDEAAVLARCLDSVCDLVDEIVIVDTGSVDATREIALRYTPHVYAFEWIDDFSAARNYAFSLAHRDYCFWLDADDLLLDADRQKFRELREALNPSVHMVMMRYHTAFDAQGSPTYSFYRERLLLRSMEYRWAGAVHESIAPRGNVIYSDIAVTHRKGKPGDSERNLRIFERELAEGRALGPRDQFYYARELTYHGRDGEAAQIFTDFLDSGDGWVENEISACADLAACWFRLGDREKGLAALLRSFSFDTPRAEICCELGGYWLQAFDYHQAAFWYRLALTIPLDRESGGFVLPDCYGYLPCLQLCVCHDRLGEHAAAFAYNEQAAAFKPNDAAVEYNRAYFNSLGFGASSSRITE